MPEDVPAEVDPLELPAIPLGTLSCGPRLDGVSQQPQRLPCGLHVQLVGTAFRSEDIGLRAKGREPFQDCGESSLRIERNSPVVLVLRGRAWGPIWRVSQFRRLFRMNAAIVQHARAAVSR